MEMFCPDIAIFVETSKQPTTVAECYEMALYAESRLNQTKEEKAKGCKDRGRKKKLNSKIVIKPSSSKRGQDNKKNAKLPNIGSQGTCSKKRSYVLKAYCGKCRHNSAGVCKRMKIVCFYCEEKGHLARNCPNKKNNEDKRKQ